MFTANSVYFPNNHFIHLSGAVTLLLNRPLFLEPAQACAITEGKRCKHFTVLLRFARADYDMITIRLEVNGHVEPTTDPHCVITYL